MKKILFLVVAFIFVSALAAMADSVTVTTNAGMFTSVLGANQAFFDSAASPGSSPYTEGVFTLTGNFGFYPDSRDGYHRAPTDDATQYVSTPQDLSGASGSYNVTFSTTGNTYFGLYWGSLDTYNSITLHTSGGDHTFTGTDLHNMTGVAIDCVAKCGDPNATSYYNFFVTGGTINSVTLESSNRALETDSYAVATPEPASLMLLGSGLLGLGGLLRRRK